MDELFAQLYVYIKGIWQYRWVAVIVAWVIAIAGWVAVYKLPDDYQASARIYVDTQNILRPLMEGMTVSPNVQQQVAIMSRTLISRPNVERILRMVDLDITVADDIAKDRLVTTLMQEISLGATAGDNIFTIAYNNKDPLLAKDIVQSLLTIFVEKGLDGKKEESSSALRFIDQQIITYEEKLIAAENSLTSFKQRNIGLLPGQGGDYYEQVATAKEALRKANLALREAEHARDAIKRQTTGDEPVDVLEPFTLATETETETETRAKSKFLVNPEIDARINSLNVDLDTLRLNFTDIHPDVIATTRLIAMLEEQKVEEADFAVSSGDVGRNFSPMLQQLNIALAEAEAVVASMSARTSEYSDRYDSLKSMSEAIPIVEAEFTQLNRDYEVNRANYEKLLERRASARMSGELTSASALMSFRIVDPPTVPDEPSGPDRALFFTIVLLAGLGIGLAIAFVVSQIRPAFYSQASLREVTGLEVLGAVPMVWTAQEKTKRKKRLYAFAFSIFALLILYIFLIMYMKM